MLRVRALLPRRAGSSQGQGQTDRQTGGVAPPSACGGVPTVPVRVGVALRVSVSTAEGYARVAAEGLVRQDGCGCGLR